MNRCTGRLKRGIECGLGLHQAPLQAFGTPLRCDTFVPRQGVRTLAQGSARVRAGFPGATGIGRSATMRAPTKEALPPRHQAPPLRCSYHSMRSQHDSIQGKRQVHSQRDAHLPQYQWPIAESCVAVASNPRCIASPMGSP
ncbi:MAG TPA: hypothetical protein VFN09_05450 [Rhodanobacteraceae bacterium]|nr:hypothetical protein [Rhodanobacteraceae bacterium]